MRKTATLLGLLLLLSSACDGGGSKKDKDHKKEDSSAKSTGTDTASQAPASTGAPSAAPSASSTAAASAAAPPASASAAAPVAPAAGDAMVDVPAAKVLGVDVPAFQIDKLEVTVASYGKCVTAGGCSAAGTGGFCNDASKSDHPQNCVEYDQAEAYCKWAGKALPTQPQWTYAALGQPPKLHPWGGGEPAIGPQSDKFICGLNQSTSASAQTCKAGERPSGASPFGALDMAGNVSEWLLKSEKSPEYYVIGSCNCSPSGGSDWADVKEARVVTGKKTRASHIGFRCVK